MQPFPEICIRFCLHKVPNPAGREAWFVKPYSTRRADESVVVLHQTSSTKLEDGFTSQTARPALWAQARMPLPFCNDLKDGEYFCVFATSQKHSGLS
ncbi:hypothetical protein GV64_23395 [Endozoicomonas elysicola]|uniref:Uncharacterized protein n=1 Tax=Endozoicomonas elysicola TaxID=305900 RepID=A0A081KGJ1_9GAMM|nr:hypothetical protein GV64_23395 [Endozoicomonas elysicola]